MRAANIFKGRNDYSFEETAVQEGQLCVAWSIYNSKICKWHFFCEKNCLFLKGGDGGFAYALGLFQVKWPFCPTLLNSTQLTSTMSKTPNLTSSTSGFSGHNHSHSTTITIVTLSKYYCCGFEIRNERSTP